MKKRFLSLLLALCLCVGLAAPALAAPGDYVIENGVLTKYTGNSPVVVIPSDVKEIGAGAFRDTSGKGTLTEVVMSSGITKLGANAFANNWNLKGVVLPNTLKEIGKMAFWNCGMEDIKLPEGLTTIGDYAFQECADLAAVDIPEGVTTIGDGAFEACWSLEEITIPASVTSIGKNAFRDCADFATVYCPRNSYAFDWFMSGNGGGNFGFAFWDEEPAAPTAYASTQTVLVDGAPVTFQCYALKDVDGNDTNYIKLRDIAYILSGSAVQFQVGWNGAVNIETGKAYSPNGSEMSTPFSGDRAYEAATAATNINGVAAALDAIVLKDDQGGAFTYYKLRDLGTALGFKVDWSAAKGIFIETK